MTRTHFCHLLFCFLVVIFSFNPHIYSKVIEKLEKEAVRKEDIDFQID